MFEKAPLITAEQMRALIREVTEKAGGEFPTEIFVPVTEIFVPVTEIFVPVDDVTEPDILAITRNVARGG
jgi:hypothetical protein